MRLFNSNRFPRLPAVHAKFQTYMPFSTFFISVDTIECNENPCVNYEPNRMQGDEAASSEVHRARVRAVKSDLSRHLSAVDIATHLLLVFHSLRADSMLNVCRSRGMAVVRNMCGCNAKCTQHRGQIPSYVTQCTLHCITYDVLHMLRKNRHSNCTQTVNR